MSTSTTSASALGVIVSEAEEFSKNARKKGSLNLAAYYMIGVIGVSAGILASAANSLPHFVVVLTGLVAAGAVAMQTFLRRHEKSRFQYNNGADAASIALAGRILADRPGPPAENELLDLIDRLTEIRQRPFENVAIGR